MSLENAPDEVKLAEIVRRDFEGKLPPHPALSPEGRGKID